MSYILVEGEEGSQGSDAWLKFREGKIGASDAPSVMGLNPWETKLEAWERFVFGKKKKKTAAMQRGNDLEGKARELFNGMFNANYVPIVAQYFPVMKIMASLDGWDGKSILEIKCPSRESHLSAKRGEVPEHYKCQMQHQMMVMGCDDAWYCSFDGEKIATVPIKRDQKFIEKLLSTEMAFISSLVDLKPPEPSDKDWKEEADPTSIVKSFRLKELRKLSTEIDVEIDDIEKYLKEGCEHPRTKIGDLKFMKVFTRGRVDYEKVVEDYKIQDIEKYRKKPTESWRIYGES